MVEVQGAGLKVQGATAIQPSFLQSLNLAPWTLNLPDLQLMTGN